MSRRYNKMKNSGVEWIKGIPADWGIRALFQLSGQVKNKNKDLAEKNLLSLSYGKIKRKDINRSDGLLPESFEGYNIIEANDIVLRLTDLQNDHTSLRVGQTEERGIITSAYTTLRPAALVNPKYLYYVIHSYDLVKGFYGMGAGVRQGLNYDEVKAIKVPFPKIKEQAAIAAYLDDRCAQIDAIIEETKASIDDYKRWKESIIFEAVTKGLNPDVKMKDSGIEWIGKVPCNWAVMRLKQFLNGKKNSMKVGPFGSQLKGADFMESGYPVYTQRTILDNNFSDNKIFVNEKKFSELRSFLVNPKDVLITTRGSIGKIAIAPDDVRKGIIHPCVIKFSTNRNIMNDEFLMYIFNGTSLVLEQLVFASNATTIDVVYSETLKNVRIPIPPITEQEEISNYLEGECSIIDSIIDEKQALITDLESYKRSLIYEVVTGKRKVV